MWGDAAVQNQLVLIAREIKVWNDAVVDLSNGLSKSKESTKYVENIKLDL